MKFFKQLFFTFFVALVGFGLSTSTASARGWNHHRYDLTEQDYYDEFGAPQNPDNLLHVEGWLLIEDTSKQEAFAFLSDLENDPLIYPGTLSAVRTSGDGGVGTTYDETIIFGGVQSDIVATILGYKQNKWLKFKADNLLQNVSAYKLRQKRGGDTLLKLESYVEVPEGVGQADMEAYLNLVFSNILTQLDTTGQVWI
jgi:hypothetical protein